MAIFELDADRTVAVQAMEPAPGAVGAQVERIIEQRLGALLGERLLTVARGRAGHDEPFLLSVDGFGGVVVTEIVTNLDAATLASALVRAGHASRLGDAELAQRYHRGPQAFVGDRAQLFTTVPEVVGGERRPGGARLVVVCAAVALDALDALEFLRQPGSRVDVLRVGVLRGTDGRRVLDVSPLGLGGRGPRGLEETVRPQATAAPQVTRTSALAGHEPVDHEVERRRLAAMVSTQALPVVTDPPAHDQPSYDHHRAPAASYAAPTSSYEAPRREPVVESPSPVRAASTYAARPEVGGAAVGGPGVGSVAQQPSAYATRSAEPQRHVEPQRPAVQQRPAPEPRAAAPVREPQPMHEPVSPARAAIGVTQTPSHATAHPRPYQPSSAPATSGASAHPAGYAGARYRARLASVEEVSIDTNPNDLSSLRDSSRSFAAAMAYDVPASAADEVYVEAPALADPDPVYLEPEVHAPEPAPMAYELAPDAYDLGPYASEPVVHAAPAAYAAPVAYTASGAYASPAALRAQYSVVDVTEEQVSRYATPHASQAPSAPQVAPPKGPRDPALAALAARLDGPAPLVWVRHRRGETIHATLFTDGVLELADGQRFWSADLAASAAVGASGIDGWRMWRLGDETGPTLAECR
ncbi:hypothetical protein [Sanguibacter sp. HDW7]|uniref:hypothetical protein n=1 Tax=Sanguibacter sp. HDW7 TaxID=2714931 RepID=UPI00140C9B02|nr:hypothetical protein [Sanguibacter sp. HDW7]QIK84414.1 hypothetical protein G7063_12910 [Sanguibacter sp. HDW7]